VKRAQRLELVRQSVHDLERRRAQTLAASERHVAESNSRLAELESYQHSYAIQFTARAGLGIGAAGLRDFQTFLARLTEAVKQQGQIVTRAKLERDTHLKSWQTAAQRAEAVGRIVKRWQAEAQRQLDSREQSESDERSQQRVARGLHIRGG
jgi:flagellar FliJ protein